MMFEGKEEINELDMSFLNPVAQGHNIGNSILNLSYIF